MADLLPDNSVNKMRIYKKTSSTPSYALYHPQTGGDQVLISNATWSGTGFTAATYYALNGATSNATSASYPYVLLSDYLTYINQQIENFAGVLEFVDARSFSDLPNTNDPTRKGNVYIVNDVNGVWWGPTSDTTKWQQYPQNTLFVCVDGSSTRSGNYINTSRSTSGAKQGWVPLGGSNDIYAKKTEALKTVSLDGSTVTFQYADTSTHTTAITFPTIGTVAAGTSAIVSAITTGTAGGAIPNVDAVRSYASSAGKVNATATTNGYLTVVSNNANGTYTVGVVSIAVSNGQSATPTLGANITGTAGKVANGFVVGNTNTVTVAYDGSAQKSLYFLDGLALTASGNSIANVSLAATPITAGVYSVLEVDTYGRAQAGAQAFVFVPNLESTSTDLNSLAVGGLAFVGGTTGSADIYSSGTATTHNIS